MMNWSPFPPKTVEAQFDEKWAFVGKKKKNCNDADLADSKQGDNWDHVAYAPEHRLVVSVVPGKRTAKNVYKLMACARFISGNYAALCLDFQYLSH